MRDPFQTQDSYGRRIAWMTGTVVCLLASLTCCDRERAEKTADSSTVVAPGLSNGEDEHPAIRDYLYEASLFILRGTERKEVLRLYGTPSFTDDRGRFWYRWYKFKEEPKLQLSAEGNEIYTVFNFERDHVVLVTDVEVTLFSRERISKLFE